MTADPLLQALLKLVTYLTEHDEEDEDDAPMMHRMDRLESALLQGMAKSRSRTFGSTY